MEALARQSHQRCDRQLIHEGFERLACRDPLHHQHVPPHRDPIHEPLAGPSEMDDAEFPGRGRQDRGIAELLGEGRGPEEGFLGGVEVDLGRRRREPFAEAGVEQRLAELQARGELSVPIRAFDRERSHALGELDGTVLLLGEPERGRAAERDVEVEWGSPSASARAASSDNPSRRSPGRRSIPRASSLAVRRPRRSCGVDACGSAISTTLRTSSGACATAPLPRPRSRSGRTPARRPPLARGGPEAEGSRAPARRSAGAGRSRRGSSPARRRQRVGRELPDLLVGEAVVRGRSFRLLDSSPARPPAPSDRRATSARPLARPPRSGSGPPGGPSS